MARQTEQLTAPRVQQLISSGQRGSYHDGLDLYLVVSGVDAASWQ